MLLQSRRFEVPRYGVQLSDLGLMHSQYRFTVKTRSGLILDSALEQARAGAPGPDRSYLLVQLEGSSLLRTESGDRLVRAGDVVCTRRDRVRGGRWEGKQKALVIEWAPGMLGTRLLPPFESGPLSTLARRRIHGALLHFQREAAPLGAKAASVAAILRLLRAEGLPFEAVEAGALQERVPDPVVALNDAIGDALSSLGRGPALTDLAKTLGRSRSWIHKTLSDLQQSFGLQTVGGWRPLHTAWRLHMALALMSAPKVRTEDAAALLGYGSPVALCNAFANAGLPSPGSIREELRKRA